MHQLFLIISILTCSSVFAQNYTVGKTWDRLPIQKLAPYIQKRVRSVGEIGSSASIFYIGKHRDKYYALTNSHVCPDQKTCDKKRIEFFYHRNSRGQSLKGHVQEVAFTHPNLDYSLLELNFKNLETFPTPPMPLKLSSKLPYKNQKLVSSGYGYYRNEYGILMTEVAGDCQVFSKTNDIKKIKDPDTINPFPFRVYSFLVGCDVSHGDSGSPIFDFKTGEVLGILWTGKMPKSPAIRTDNLKQLNYSFLWEQLNYAVPSLYIKSSLKKYFKSLDR